MFQSYVTPHKTLSNYHQNKTCYIFDGMSVVQALGRPSRCKTFDEYAAIFSSVVFKIENEVQRIDVVFDHYKSNSIKNTTRRKRGPQSTMQRIIENENIPLPQQWNLFIHSSINKHQLTNFL